MQQSITLSEGAPQINLRHCKEHVVIINMRQSKMFSSGRGGGDERWRV